MKKYILKHKIIAIMIIAAIIVGGYFVIKKINSDGSAVQYATAAVEKGMLISSISGTGQVSALSQVDLKPKASGEVVAMNVKAGQKVKRSALLAQIDARDAARKLSEAKSSLENAKLDLQELLAPADKLTLIQAENSLRDAQDSLAKLKITQVNNYDDALKSKKKAEDNLEKAYEDSYNDIADVFLDLPDIMTGLYNILYSDEIADNEASVAQNSNEDVLINSILSSDATQRNKFESYVTSSENDYQTAKTDYDKNFDDYKTVTRYADRKTIEDLLNQNIQAVKKISDAVKSESNMIDFWVEYRTNKNFSVYADVSGYQSDLDSYTSKIGSHLSTLLSSERSIEDYKESIIIAERDIKEMEQNNPLELAAAERSLVEKEQKLADLKAGAGELEIKNKKLAVQQKENSLLEAQANYADYFIRAPFDGQVAEVNVAKGDDASSATAVAILITEQKIAEITLNEIDAAKVKTGQKATLTFDAVADLSITGQVVEIDTIGTVSQGVVSYNVKIAFDVADERIKPGMSTGVSIIIESKLGVLMAPLSSVKTSVQGSYAEVLLDGVLQRKTVTTGSSNDTMIEIVSGLTEGEEIVTQTISSTSSNSGQTQNSRTGGAPGGMMIFR